MFCWFNILIFLKFDYLLGLWDWAGGPGPVFQEAAHSYLVLLLLQNKDEYLVLFPRSYCTCEPLYLNERRRSFFPFDMLSTCYLCR